MSRQLGEFVSAQEAIRRLGCNGSEWVRFFIGLVRSKPNPDMAPGKTLKVYLWEDCLEVMAILERKLKHKGAS